jgi:quinol monooxygenase YgiN
MPVVVAVLTPKDGRLGDLLDAFAEVSPKVHREPGCELYAVHSDGSVCVVVERWTTQGDLDTHAAGAAMQELSARWGDALAKPFEAWIVENIPLGDPAIGTVR